MVVVVVVVVVVVYYAWTFFICSLYSSIRKIWVGIDPQFFLVSHCFCFFWGYFLVALSYFLLFFFCMMNFYPYFLNFLDLIYSSYGIPH